MGEKMRTVSCTCFIPCTDTQAVSALYALNLLKRSSYKADMQNELSHRPDAPYLSVYREVIKETTASFGFFTGFNFSGRVETSKGKSGVLLTFYNDSSTSQSLYSFKPGHAITFCQAVLRCFSIDQDVEIAHFKKTEGRYHLLGTIIVSRDDFEFLSAEYPWILFWPENENYEIHDSKPIQIPHHHQYEVSYYADTNMLTNKIC